MAKMINLHDYLPYEDYNNLIYLLSTTKYSKDTAYCEKLKNGEYLSLDDIDYINLLFLNQMYSSFSIQGMMATGESKRKADTLLAAIKSIKEKLSKAF